MIFLLFANLYVVQIAKKWNCFYKLSGEDKILSSLIKWAWGTCTFLNHFKEGNEQLLWALFLRIDFDVIPTYIELPCFNSCKTRLFKEFILSLYYI